MSGRGKERFLAPEWSLRGQHLPLSFLGARRRESWVPGLAGAPFSTRASRGARTLLEALCSELAKGSGSELGLPTATRCVPGAGRLPHLSLRSATCQQGSAAPSGRSWEGSRDPDRSGPCACLTVRARGMPAVGTVPPGPTWPFQAILATPGDPRRRGESGQAPADRPSTPGSQGHPTGRLGSAENTGCSVTGLGGGGPGAPTLHPPRPLQVLDPCPPLALPTAPPSLPLPLRTCTSRHTHPPCGACFVQQQPRQSGSAPAGGREHAPSIHP